VAQPRETAQPAGRSVDVVRRLALQEAVPIANPIEPTGMTQIRIVGIDDVLPSSRSPKQKTAVGKHLSNDPKLLDVVAVVVAVGGRMDVSCAAPRMCLVLHSAIDNGVTWFERSVRHGFISARIKTASTYILHYFLGSLQQKSPRKLPLLALFVGKPSG